MTVRHVGEVGSTGRPRSHPFWCEPAALAFVFREDRTPGPTHLTNDHPPSALRWAINILLDSRAVPYVVREEPSHQGKPWKAALNSREFECDFVPFH
jgi:hypothetical protein